MNKKIAKTHHTFRQALFELLDRQDLAEITVSKLCARAAINRTTFYKYYSIPADVLWLFVDEINQTIFERISTVYTADVRQDTAMKMQMICSIYYENRQIIEVFMRQAQEITPFLTRLMTAGQPGNLRDNSRVIFMAGGVAALIMQWARQGFKLHPDEMSSILSDYIVQLLP